MRWLRVFAFFSALALAPHVAWAVQPDEILSDATLEARARTLSKQLRCLVCQNQSIDDSDAPLAHDLRVLVRERLQAGDSNQQVLDFLVQRYGEFVLLRPRLSWRTALLWSVAPGLLIGGGIVLLIVARRRSGHGVTESAQRDGLSTSEQARLARLLAPDDR
jgi:cytochrome c-type biogenesis protein CcmH